MFDTVKNLCASFPQRWVLAFMCFLGLITTFSMRSCLSIAITEMVVPTKETKNITDEDRCPSMVEPIHPNSSYLHVENSRGVFEWDESVQGMILSSFYWGYVPGHIPGGLFSEKHGGKLVFGIAILLNAALTLLTPTAIYWGDYTALVCLRVLLGLCQGVIYPAINVLLAQWVPIDERSRTASFVFGGALLGTVYSMTVSGWILKYSEMGWPLVFYFFGSVSVLWIVLWMVICYNNPREHPFISEQEANYLKEKMSEHTHETPPESVPWIHMFESKACWALALAQAGFSASILTLITELPKYNSSVLKFSVDYNGYLSSLMFLFMCIGGNAFSWVADFLISKDVSVTRVRKGMSVIALPVSAAALVAASYAGCDRVLVVACFAAALLAMGAAYPSIMVNSLDLSPNHAATLTGVTNGLATSTAIVSPLLVGILAPNQTLTEWRQIFWIIFGVAIVFNFIFLRGGSGEVQYWNDPELVKKKNEEWIRKYQVNAESDDEPYDLV